MSVYPTVFSFKECKKHPNLLYKVDNIRNSVFSVHYCLDGSTFTT